MEFDDVSTAPPFNYFEIASQHVPNLAKDVNEKMMYIRNSGAKTIELYGHSLGAHVAGQAGRLFKEKMGVAVDEIFGKIIAVRYSNNT